MSEDLPQKQYFIIVARVTTAMPVERDIMLGKRPNLNIFQLTGSQ